MPIIPLNAKIALLSSRSGALCAPLLHKLYQTILWRTQFAVTKLYAILKYYKYD